MADLESRASTPMNGAELEQFSELAIVCYGLNKHSEPDSHNSRVFNFEYKGFEATLVTRLDKSGTRYVALRISENNYVSLTMPNRRLIARLIDPILHLLKEYGLGNKRPPKTRFDTNMNHSTAYELLQGAHQALITKYAHLHPQNNHQQHAQHS
jgi:hypothetical protein